MNLLGSWIISREEKLMLYKYIEICQVKNAALEFVFVNLYFV